MAEGKLLLCEEAFSELEKKHDVLYDWVKKREGCKIMLDEAQILTAKSIMRSYPRLVDNRTNRSGADPFVIALAQERGLTVVTGEEGGTANKPKIPSVCLDLGIKCLNIPEFLDAQGWTF